MTQKTNQHIHDNTNYSICILGCGGVGKSAITLRYINNTFVAYHDPTIEDMYKKQVCIDGIYSSIELLDTAGQEDYSMLYSTWIRDKHGFLFVFDITNQTTLQQLNTYYNHYISLYDTSNNEQRPPILLVGNKSDLSTQRQVSIKDAETIAIQYNADYIETSAKNGTNIEQLFDNLIRQIRKKQYNKQPTQHQQQQVQSVNDQTCCTIT